jgi:3-oxoacyl-[acyl-carrier protein] reductase
VTDLSRSVAGKVVIVTGAASGMGRATALLLTQEGAKVGVVDRDERVTEVGDHAVVADVADPGAPENAVAEIRDRLGPVYGLVNNAGVAIPAPIDGETFDDAWATTLAINLTAYAQFVRAALPTVERIVNVASTEGLGATPQMAPYTAAKHGVIGLTKSLAVELGPRGITANAICPGPIETGMTELIPQEIKQRFARRRTALHRYGRPEEVAHITLSLLLPAASYITGAAIPVDGGLIARND